MTTIEQEQPGWETETGLVNDVDAWIANAFFGKRDEYAQKVAETAGQDPSVGLMFLFDLIDESGEVIGSQGYSVGSGWVPSDDGSEISHPKRNNVVGSCRYGELQNRVVRELKVNMQARGTPLQARSWNGLGFHWLQEEKTTVGKELRQVLMPIQFLSVKGDGTPAPAPTAAPAAVGAPVVADAITTKLAGLLKVYADDVSGFQKAALQIPEVSANDQLMSEVLDDGPEGYFAKHKG